MKAGNETARRSNHLLVVGSIWGLVAVLICPCPVCILGTLGVLGTGLWEKTGMSRRVSSHRHTSSCRCQEKREQVQNDR